MTKISIRFYNDCEVRAVWDERMRNLLTLQYERIR